MTTFAVRLLRGFSIGARRAAAGAELQVDAVTAAGLIRQGVAVLADEADLARLAQALGAGRWSAPATR